jgi:hypothetical protein
LIQAGLLGGDRLRDCVEADGPTRNAHAIDEERGRTGHAGSTPFLHVGLHLLDVTARVEAGVEVLAVQPEASRLFLEIGNGESALVREQQIVE